MKLLKNIEKLVKKFDIHINPEVNEAVLAELLQAQAEYLKDQKMARQRSAGREPFVARFPRLAWTCGLVAIFIATISCLACLVQTRKVVDLEHELEYARRDVVPARPDDTTTINLYLKEHQDVAARYASHSPVTAQPAQMRVSQDDVMYYEFLGDGPEYMHPGIIVRGPPSDREIKSSGDPVISNGHTLTLSEAQKTAGFDLVSPLLFHPGYSLDRIRRIEDRDALQLLYTDGINSISLFEQPLDAQRGLEAKDFREYAVYRNTKQAGGTILAWRDDELSYVLIGNTDMSQLMNMAQSINAGK
jgi:hypothetical protein